MNTAENITGQFHYAGSSTRYFASVAISPDGELVITDHSSATELIRARTGEYRFGAVIPGVAVELQLHDGALFTPDDQLFRWPQLTNQSTLAARLESHKVSILVSLLLSPLLMWWIIVDLMPMLAGAAVPLVPDSVKRQMGQQTLQALQKTVLEESRLSAETRQQIHHSWQQVLPQLSLQHSNYQLYFYHSAFFGANAFALPDGTVIITDDLVTLLDDQPDAILAVLLHEIGHVEGQHSVRLIAQSLGTTLIFSILFGDPEGVAELLLGSGSALLQNNFSRNMEREADQFALQQLQLLGKSPAAFADAMSALIQQYGAQDSDTSLLLKYLSTHPETAERIEKARTYTEQ
ncbi:M48 family metallopeptidase [Chromatiaceae bacterium AAb-1]|nr:M48 family metallopeptidase [Chromatiaceae bacterium AAb-1]